MKNLFCDLSDLRNEASVESLFVNGLFGYLEYPDSRLHTRESNERLAIPRGRATENYVPDYVLLDSRNQPVIIIDTKHPQESDDV